MNLRNGRLMPLLAAALLGAIGGFAQAPYDLAPLIVTAMAGAIWMYQECRTPLRAGLLGWAFGTGYLMHAFQWIISPFMVDAARHGWMAPFALVLLAAGMALYWGLAFGIARWISHRVWPLIFCWPLAELARAYLFTGFAWAMPSQALVDVMAGQALAWAGPYGMNLWLMGGALILGLRRPMAPAARVGQIAVAVGVVLPLVLPPVLPEAEATDHTVRLIQPNAAQHVKYDPEMIPVFFARQLEFTSAPPQDGGAVPDLVIWSETAIPWSLDLAGTALAQIAQAGGEATVTLGVQRREDLRFFNSMVVLGPEGAVTQSYDKHHLVPYGEYMPLGDLAARFGVYGLAAAAGNGYSSGPGAKLLDFGALGTALPLICYEAVFPHDVNAAPSRPSFLVQITNDAWFGRGAGPKQHLAQARMRAIEQGLPLARAANTGISAMIDPYGRVTASLPLNVAGFVDARLPAPLPPTLYSRTGDLPLALLLLAALAGTVVRRLAS